jgi:hypothetical protein
MASETRDLFYYSSDPQDRTPISEQNPAKTEEAPDLIFPPTDHGARETISPTKVPRLRGTIYPSQGSENDRCAGQNLVPEPSNKMEVIGITKVNLEISIILVEFCIVYPTIAQIYI